MRLDGLRSLRFVHGIRQTTKTEAACAKPGEGAATQAAGITSARAWFFPWRGPLQTGPVGVLSRPIALRHTGF